MRIELVNKSKVCPAQSKNLSSLTAATSFICQPLTFCNFQEDKRSVDSVYMALLSVTRKTRMQQDY